MTWERCYNLSVNTYNEILVDFRSLWQQIKTEPVVLLVSFILFQESITALFSTASSQIILTLLPTR